MVEHRTPLYDVHRTLGATFTTFAGWLMPLRYGSELLEHHAVRHAAGMFDLSHMGEIEVTGPDAARFLDYAFVGLLSALRVGGARYTMLCDNDGGIVDDLVVYRLAEQHFLVVPNASNVAVVDLMLCGHAEGYRVAVRVTSPAWALIAVQGPSAAAIVAAVGDVDVGSLRRYSVTRARIRAAPVVLARTGYTGEDGFEVFCAVDDAVRVWTALYDAGTAHGMMPAGLACRDTLRLEAGMALHGSELSRQRNPFQAGLGRLVALGKGSFVGKEALQRLPRVSDGDAVLVGLAARQRRSPRAGHLVLEPDTGVQVGTVTSGALSPTLGHPVAMAYVEQRHAQPGVALTVDVRGRHIDVEVVAMPFLRR